MSSDSNRDAISAIGECCQLRAGHLHNGGVTRLPHSAPQVVVLGDLVPDLVLRGDVVPRFGQAEQLLSAAEMVVGGSGAIVACGLARLGVRTALVASVGDDAFGQLMVDRVRAAGVDTRWVQVHPYLPTGLTVILSAGDRAVLTFAGALESLVLDEEVQSLVNSAKHVHSASFFLMPGAADRLGQSFRRARAHGVSTSLDTNWDPAERWGGVDEVFPHVDYWLPNTAELLAVLGVAGSPDDSAILQRAAAPVHQMGVSVVLKAGADGGRYWGSTGEVLTSPALAVEAVDTTGAGDSFDAGFLAGLVAGLDHQTCLEWAAACGSLSVRGPGGTGAQPTLAELRTALAATSQ